MKRVSPQTQDAGLSRMWCGVLTWEFVWVRRPPRSWMPGVRRFGGCKVEEGGWGCDEGGVMVRGVGFFGNW